VTVLDVAGLRVHYHGDRGRVRAVDDVSFRLGGPGRVLGLIGESGSGKTSIALALLRLLPGNVAEFAGDFRLDGVDLLALPDHEFRRRIRWRSISMVFQGAMSSLNPVLRVGRQVAEPLRLTGVSGRNALAEADRLLELVGLSAGTGRRYPHELSGGMKQRVVIAMALVLEPRLVILDEPTSALDASVQAQIMNLLKRLAWDLGISMLFITHDIALASDLCDDLAVIHAGEIREQGPADRVLTRPLDPYTRALLASVPRLRSASPPRFLPGDPPDPVAPPPGCRFHLRCEYAFAPCPHRAPPLFEPAEGHLVRCWLYEPGAGLAPPGAAEGDEAVGEAPAARAAPSPEAADALVRAEGLGVRFRSRGRLLRPETVYAVTDVDLQIRPGETVALVGESGSGKTTLGRATLGLVPAATGRVVFDGTDLGALDRRGLHAFRRRAQAVFQDPFASISPFMSVFESVEEPLLIHGPGDRRAREQRVLDILEQVRLVPARRFAAAYPHTLSGGQRQRVGIARALVLDPDYVVADEPVSMIDASSRAEILDLMRELQQRRRLALLYITHDIATARHFSDRIAVMYLGRIVEFGPSRDVVADPQHPYTKALLAAVPEPDPANRGRLRDVVPGEPPDPIRVPSGCAFHPRCPVAIDGVCPEVLPLLETAAGRLVACHLVTGVPLPPIRRA
jgi:peptide/nickel transport system ATP-binding protein